MPSSLDLLNQLISINSVFPAEAKLAEFVVEWLKKETTCEVKLQPVSDGRSNILVTKAAQTSQGKAFLLAGHLDTVPVVRDWQTDPHQPVEQDGKLIGLGAWDMKAGLWVMLQCLKEFEPQTVDLKAVFTIDEENFSIGAHAVIDSGFTDNVIGVLVPEPGFTHGDQGITIGRTGRATFEVNILGKSAHGSFPQDGINAITEATALISLFKDVKLAVDPDMGPSVLFPRKITSEASGFSVPDQCYLELDCKMVPPDTAESILKVLQEKVSTWLTEKKLAFPVEIKLRERPTPFCSPYKLAADSELVKQTEVAVTQISGQAKVFFRESVADECIYVERLQVPALCIGPTGDRAHQAGEWVELASVERVKNIYLAILKEMDKI